MRDEGLAEILHQAFERRVFDRDNQAMRDRHALPIYEFTAELATLQPPPPELQRVLAAAQGNPEAMDGFARVYAGVVSPADYFSKANVARIVGAAPSS
jgi:hypothetical protein